MMTKGKDTEIDMPIIAITNELYTGSEKIIQLLGEKLGSPVVTDIEIIEKTHLTHHIKPGTLKKVIESKQIAFNKFTHEKEECISALKKTLSDLVQEGNYIFHGILSHLIPRENTHVMRFFIYEDKKKRIEQGMEAEGISEKQALKKVNLSDKYTLLWTMFLFGKEPRDPTLYDRVIPLGKLDPKAVAKLINEYFTIFATKNKDLIKQEIFDFKLSADIDLVLSQLGHGLLVKADKGHVVVTIDKKAKMLAKFQQKIIQAVEAFPGVTMVETKIGKNYYK